MTRQQRPSRQKPTARHAKKYEHNDQSRLLFRLRSILTGWRTIQNSESLPTETRTLPGLFPTDEKDVLSQMRLWQPNSTKYKRCQNTTNPSHWVHLDDMESKKCYKCAQTQLKKPQRRPVPVLDADEQLKQVQFRCLQNFTENEFIQSMKKVGNPVLLKVGTKLILKRSPVDDVCGQDTERFAQIPITADGTLAEICISICHYYDQRLCSLANGEDYQSLELRGIFKIDDTCYGCIVSKD
ncbi:hypothetical protein EJ07DRAFT_159380 [Lizonia empirigonia]|nr:hypothetical protein EJ07DRAFT_159380 [Lizonia empirigonia]